MKNYTGIIAVAALFFAHNVVGDRPPVESKSQQDCVSHYRKFLQNFNRTIISADNLIDRSWVIGALDALIEDGISKDLSRAVFAEILWATIKKEVGRQAKLLKNASKENTFNKRIYESLIRTVEEFRFAEYNG